MSVIVHSVQNNVVPHIASPCGLFGCDVRPWLPLLLPAGLSRAVPCCRVCDAAVLVQRGRDYVVVMVTRMFLGAAIKAEVGGHGGGG